MFEKTDNYLYQYIHEVTEYHLHTNNPKKDTIDYMFLQCHKTEFLRQVAQINPFQTTNFAWIDFGIFHMIKNDDDLKRGILHLSTKSYSSIRIASCVDLNKVCVSDVYKNVVWYFAGSVIGGHRDALIEYAEIMKQKCISIIQEKHHIMWEINIWYLLYKDHIHLFEPYHADHNLSVLLYY
jgi:hypothetical protein